MPLIAEYCYFLWRCEHCCAKQKIESGNVNDLTLPDYNVMRCYVCKKLELLISKDEFRQIYNLETDVILTDELLEKYGLIIDGQE